MGKTVYEASLHRHRDAFGGQASGGWAGERGAWPARFDGMKPVVPTVGFDRSPPMPLQEEISMRNPRTEEHPWKARGGGILLLAVMSFWLFAIPGARAARPPSTPLPILAQPSADVPQIYDVTEIIPRSDLALARLRAIRKELESNSNIDVVESGLPNFDQQLREWWEAESLALKDGHSIQLMSDISLELVRWSAQLDGWKSLLATNSKAWADESQSLDRGQANWQATLAGLKADAPQAARDRVVHVQGEITSVKQLFNEKLAELVAIQVRLEQEGRTLGRMREELDVLQKNAGYILLKRDSPPLWTALLTGEPGRLLAFQARDGFSRLYRDSMHAFDLARPLVVLDAIVFLSLVSVLVSFRRGFSENARVRPTHSEQLIIDRCISSAFLVMLAVVPLLSPEMTPRFARLLVPLGLIAVLRLAPVVFPARFRDAFYCFVAIWLVDFLRNYLPLPWLLARLLLLCISVLGALGIAALLLRLRHETTRGTGWAAVLLAAGMVLLLASLAANVAGNLSLAEYLASPLVRVVFLGVAVRLLVVAASTFFVMVLRSSLAMHSRMIQHRAEETAAQIRRAINVAGLLFWIYLALFNLGLLPFGQAAVFGFLNTEWDVGAAAISVSDVVTFFEVFLAAYLLSRALRLILADEILPRVRLPRGVPDVLVLFSRYGVLLFGFLLALTSAGVNLSQVTLALSALGVGIGFGLQNVVNNFVSGLILVFEHPIQVGDYIEVGPHYGRVRRIGFRASILVTKDGSDVVIPNAELIGGKVVNWSLSEAIRRINIRVPVAAGTDTQRVIDILESIARDCPRVRSDHPAHAVLEEFGDHALKFLLLCWVRTEQMTDVRHDLTLAIARALREAGIRMPSAETEVRLHFPGQQPAGVPSVNVPNPSYSSHSGDSHTGTVQPPGVA